MILFFDACSSHGYIGLYSLAREKICSEPFEIAGNESSKAIHLIDVFLQKHHYTYGELTHIICVNGPGSFTGIRTISLIVNTLSFIYTHIYLTPLSFFDLYDDYPIVKSSSKRDLFVKYDKGDIIHIEKNDSFNEKFTGKRVYGDVPQEILSQDIQIVRKIDYDTICKTIELQQDSRIAPLYIKKPNIS